MIRWRQLFDSLRIEWKDRGSNCSRGHVNISCPQCGRNDPSFHLSINEEDGAYYCYRQPGHHSGRSLPWLLICLQVEPHEIDHIIAEFSDDRQVARSAPTQKSVDWRKFESATEVQICLDYLEGRGFANPKMTCLAYDLRFTRFGNNAWRLLFPLTTANSATGVTGRALREHQSPRYLTNDPFGCSIYLPRASSARMLLVCEGPFDALAAAAVAVDEALPVMPAAILGTSLPIERRMHLARLAKQVEKIIYVPDQDQSRADTYRLIESLEGTPGIDQVAVYELPSDYKDIAKFYETDKTGVRKWMRNVTSSLNGNSQPSKSMHSNM
jgi:hypothetical protein